MKVLSKPTWVDGIKLKPFPKLKQDLKTDVVIIGGGMVGILSAYQLAKAGKAVVLLESGRLLAGATSMTTAFLTQIYDTDTADSISMYGANRTKQIWDSHGKAIDYIENIIKEEKISCEFVRCSNFSYGNAEDDIEKLQEEYNAMKKLGFSVSFKKKNDLGFPNFGYIETKRQGKFHPLKFLGALVPELVTMGVQIYEQSPAEKVIGKGPVKVVVGKNSIKAQYAITATYNPLNNPKETFMKKGMYVSYVYEVKLPKGIFKEGIYEDFENPYHYFRIDWMSNYDRMIIGGEDNRKEIEFDQQKNFDALTDYIEHIMKGKKYSIIRKWRGPILEPSDGLPLIGQFKPGQLIAAAFSGNGMTYSAIAAMLFSDIILGNKNQWKTIYDPTRIPTAKQLLFKARDYGEEFIKAAVRNTLKY